VRVIDVCVRNGRKYFTQPRDVGLTNGGGKLLNFTYLTGRISPGR
jgi:hypothetical protein